MHWALLTVALASPVDDAVDDLTDVLTVLDLVHPDLERHVSREALDSIVVEEEARLSDLEVTPREVTRSVFRLVAAVGDGHLETGWPALDPVPVLLPFRPRWVGDQAVVEAAADPSWVGREITSIEGVSAAALREQLDPLLSVDGGRATEAALRFDPWRVLHLVVPPAESFTFTLDDETITADGVTPAELQTLKPRPGPLPTWTHDRERTVLSLPHFGNPDRAAYVAAIDAGFEVLDTEELVLDLRGNPGGFRELGAAVTAHLVDSSFTQWASVRADIQKVPRRLRKRMEVPYGLPSKDIDRALRKGFSWSHDGDPAAPLMTPREPHYDGPVVVWVDGITESAAVEMLVGLRAHREIVVVGEETGGACEGHMGEWPVVFTTPNYGVPVMISLQEITQVDTGCEPDRGVLPDIEVHWTLDPGEDPWVDATTQ